MKKRTQSLHLSLPINRQLLVIVLLFPLLTLAQTKSFKVAAKLYPVDLLHNQYNALHGGIELYKHPFSLHVSYGANAGVKLGNGHEGYQKGYKYKAGLRYYFSTKDPAGASLPSAFIQVLYTGLNYTQQRYDDHYTDLAGQQWQYKSAQVNTHRSGLEVQIGKNLVIYHRLMVEASAGLVVGYFTHQYSNQTGVGEYTRPTDFMFLGASPKYYQEGRSFVVRPSLNLGIVYWLW